jgi:hypothetical protein
LGAVLVMTVIRRLAARLFIVAVAMLSLLLAGRRIGLLVRRQPGSQDGGRVRHQHAPWRPRGVLPGVTAVAAAKKQTQPYDPPCRASSADAALRCTSNGLFTAT